MHLTLIQIRSKEAKKFNILNLVFKFKLKGPFPNPIPTFSDFTNKHLQYETVWLMNINFFMNVLKVKKNILYFIDSINSTTFKIKCETTFNILMKSIFSN